MMKKQMNFADWLKLDEIGGTAWMLPMMVSKMGAARRRRLGVGIHKSKKEEDRKKEDDKDKSEKEEENKTKDDDDRTKRNFRAYEEPLF